MPWIVPSSPKVPCSTGNTTSRPAVLAPVAEVCRDSPGLCSSSSANAAEMLLTAAACALRVEIFLPATFADAINCGSVLPASSASASPPPSHWPLFAMPMGTTSYFLRSIDLRIDSADRSETSCSPERPPNNTPTRSFFAIVPHRAACHAVTPLMLAAMGMLLR